MVVSKIDHEGDMPPKATNESAASPKLSKMNYRVVNQLGAGAGSAIFQISDKSAGGKRYALKVVKRHSVEDDPMIAQAQQEYDVSQKLNHPAILKIHDIRQKKNWMFKVRGVELLMEYVDGKTLDQIELPEISQLILMFVQVASAMSHMHRRGVYHGDLKPQNIMLSKTGQVKLIDFGTAWLRGQDKDRIQGTPQYMAPEQISEKVVDEKTDIYNFGATMYRMFTGRVVNAVMPKAGEPRKLAAPKQVNPNLPTPLNDLILTCVEMEPSRRPDSMYDVAQKLETIAKGLGLDMSDLKGVTEEDE